jgi:hypothetical protein
MANVTTDNIDVREDTAKAYRGTYWALLSIGAFILIVAILFFAGFFTWLTGNSRGQPATSGPSQDSITR